MRSRSPSAKFFFVVRTCGTEMLSITGDCRSTDFLRTGLSSFHDQCCQDSGDRLSYHCGTSKEASECMWEMDFADDQTEGGASLQHTL